MKCIHCGQELPADSYICPNCGKDNNLEELLKEAKIPSELDHLSYHQIVSRIKRIHLIKKKYLVAFVAVLFLFVAYIFIREKKSYLDLSKNIYNFHDDLVEKSSMNAAGNSNSNLANGGQLVMYGHQMYVSSDGKLYCINLSLNQKSVVANQTCQYLNIVQDTLFYIDPNQDNAIVVMNLLTNTSTTTKVKAKSLMVVGDYLYYLEAGSHGAIYQMKTDFTSQKVLTQRGCKMFNIVSDWLYYTTDDGLYRVPVLGGEVAKVEEGQYNHFVISDQIFYYLNASNQICKTSFDGHGPGKIVEDSVSDFVVTNRYLYYAKKDAGVFKQSLETGEIVQLSTERAHALQIAGSWIYYQLVDSDEGRFVTIDENSETVTPVFTISQ